MSLILIQIIAGALGGLFLYAALFLRETEEGRLQNLLESWWVSLDDAGRVAVTKHAQFMIHLSATLDSLLSRFLGHSLWSVRAFLICTLSSLSALYANVLILAAFSGRDPIPHLGISQIDLTISIILCLAFAGGAYHLGWGRTVTGAALAVTAFVCFLIFPPANISFETTLLTDMIFLAALIPSFIINAALVALARVGLRFCKRASSAWLIALVLAGSFISIMLVTYAVSTLSFLTVMYWDWDFIGTIGAVAASANIPAMMVSFLVVIAATILLLHVIIWPIIARPVYAAQRHGLIQKRKTLCFIGLSLIGIASPGFGAALKDFADGIGL